jgi:small-conductance mechanosensitive channel
MIEYKHEIMLSIALILIMGILLLTMKWLVKKFSRLKAMNANRIKVVLNLGYLAIYLLAGILLTVMWGVDMKQFTLLISSILAVLGVGFFAQWSILSNLTASVILFFNHPLRIGDKIRILDKDFNWTGVVTDISGFYLFMTTDADEKISIPTSMVMQRGIEILEK